MKKYLFSLSESNHKHNWLSELKKENQKKTLPFMLGLLGVVLKRQNDEKVGRCPECERNKYDRSFPN